MSLDLKMLEKELAEYKVYDAWQYVISLRETLSYMNASYEIICKVYEHRKKVLSSIQDELIDIAMKTGSSTLTKSTFDETNLKIGGYEIDDSLFLRKTTLEFFHYARISMEVIYQIVNAALLGDQAFLISEMGLPAKISRKLDVKTEFQALKGLLDSNFTNSNYKYLTAFDNYIKHIKTVLITVKNSFIFGNKEEFMINEFFYKGLKYEACDAITIVRDINNYVIDTIDNVLSEVMVQIPNCLDNSQRIQEIKFKAQIRKGEAGDSFDFISFFIEVDDISDLPSEIKVYPLIVKPNDEIYSFDFTFNKIFLKKKDSDKETESILGYAELKNGTDTNEFYRVYEIKEGGYGDYISYLAGFNKEYNKFSLNFNAMEGSIIMYEDKNLK